ncbi:MAG: hypothetical protein WC002_00460 [Candidatus Muiribacteriota bacterium]|jgi:shikimate 5-dehydrogenase
MFTDSFFLLGGNVSKSLSPEIYNFLFKHFNLKMNYSGFSIDKNNFESLINILKKIPEIKGFNITYPYKEHALKFTLPDAEAKIIGGINTIVKKNNDFYSFNTDGMGFVKFAGKNYLKNTNSIAILGTGITGRSIAYNIRKKYADSKITFFSRNKTNIQNKNFFNSFFFDIINYEKFNCSDFDLIINVTPVCFDDLKLNMETFCGKIFDINYFNCKNSYGGGVDLLTGQALLNFEIFTGINADNLYEQIKTNLLEVE